ncbi:alpha/beta hydrolase [Acidiferrimicrobium sp. IK]|uniref:alpha/beta hydrolase n=1 Tax=Acidiferrimicrobium sp. IK TaxID=2871700 RepID=UPI0021CB2BA6|nr:alpha/beta hydrolase [Acidiferrimicrobium sp. IK]MCU4186638.1 alpha/beta hydrolase [Acidiferrimicrobium sp. IK]
MTTGHNITIDVGDGEHLAATVHLPAGDSDSPGRVVAFGFPGGGLARGYFGVQFDEDDSYNQAAFHTARGWIFVACDHLGVGDSSQPDPASLTYARLARANDVAARRVVADLREGTLLEGIGPVDVAFTVGLGHSMGGGITIVTQGNHDTFDAVGVLGFSALQTVIPTPEGRLAVDLQERDDPSGGLETSIESAGGVGMFRWAFYREDVPAALVDADMGSGYPRSAQPPPWGSATTPPVVFSMLSPGVVAGEAAAITAPVLVASGDRDVIPDLRSEPTAYRACRDMTLTEIPGMAHMHNFAGTRVQLWDRLHRWVGAMVD